MMQSYWSNANASLFKVGIFNYCFIGVSKYVYVCMYVCMYICTYIYIYIYMYMYMYIYIYIRVNWSNEELAKSISPRFDATTQDSNLFILFS